MDIANVGKNGGIERGSDRAARADGKGTVLIPQPPRDEARISSESRETAAAVTNLAERVRNLPSERAEVVAAAKAKLVAGQLDGDAVFGATARALLDAKFNSA